MCRCRPAFAALTVAISTTIIIACAERIQPTQEPARPREGSSSLENVQPPASDPLPRDRKPPPLVIPPAPFVQPLPVYPSQALEAEVACSARLLYHVERDGTARLVRLEWESAPPQEHLEVFEASIRNAIANWDFAPAQKIVPVKQPDGSIEPDGQPVPYAQHAIVGFRVVEGRGVVE